MCRTKQCADYGNLTLIAFANGDGTFGVRVIDKSDLFVFWAGTCASMEEAKESAILESQLFLDGLSPLSQWGPHAGD